MRSTALCPFWLPTIYFLLLSLISAILGQQQNSNSNSCAGTIFLNASKEEQYLTTPNYETSYKYPAFLDCKFYIKAPDKTRIVIEIIDMEMEPRLFEECSDYISLSEENKNVSRISVLCEEIKFKQQYISINNSLLLTFHSDELYEFRGARLTYRYFDLTSCPPGWREISEGRCVLLVTGPKVDWIKAQNRCLDQRSNLLALDSDEKVTELENLFKGVPDKIWTGNNDAVTEGKLIDISNREAKRFSRQDYTAIIDNNEDNDCLVLQFSDENLFRMDSCGSFNGYICEMFKNGTSELYEPNAIDIYDGAYSKNSQYTLILLLFLIGLLFLTIAAFLCFMCWKQKDARVHTENATIQQNAFMSESSHNTEQPRVSGGGGGQSVIQLNNDTNRATSRSSPVTVPIESNSRPAPKKFPVPPVPNRLPMSEENSSDAVAAVETGILGNDQDVETVSAAPQPVPRTLPPMPTREGTFHSINTRGGSTVRTRRNKELFERPVMNVLDNVSAISLDEFWSNKKP
ncbi:hypothetical protein B9Z55_023058 [Caenorhabditis nigoni]|uniref:CUB domain-containing protein n=1 Tax=Caenorhabditis nigoni TaxID=1611254 RepID=A0A2G5SNM9_9PELO|nr:hypothetical protein B9Z55_023058 [Caenorhabditis nigoni]